MSHALTGRPAAHLLARLARHVAPDLRIAGSGTEWILARPLEGSCLHQRISRRVRARAAAGALARQPDQTMLAIGVPTPRNPAPQALYQPGGRRPEAVLPEVAALRADAARALKALKGLPAPLALLHAGGGWLLDPYDDAILSVGVSTPGEVRWRQGPPRLLAEPSDLARRLHALLPETAQDLPALAALGTAHARLRHGLSEAAVQALYEAMPLSGTRFRIRHAPGLLALLRLTPSGRAVPVLVAAFP